MADNNESKKRSKLHNYLLLTVLFVVSIVVVLYLCELYKVNREEQMKIPVIRDSISEIYPEDLEHYVVDNSIAVFYVCVANDEECRVFERDFKKLLRKKNYSDQIIYLNLTDVDQDAFVKEFNEKYHYKTKLTKNYPAFILFEDGEVQKILQRKENSKLTITKVKNFLELIEFGE